MATNEDDVAAEVIDEEENDEVSATNRVEPLIRFSMEGRRRQRRHLDIQEAAKQDAFVALGGKLDAKGCIPEDADRSQIESVWQINLPRRLLALSYLGVFKFRILLTSSPVDMLYFDQHHPMITTGHLPHNDEERFIIQQLRDEFPDWSLIQENVRLQPNNDLAHALGAAAVVACGAMFYYMAQGMVVVVEKHLTAEELEAEQPLPDNVAGVAKPTMPYANRLMVAENSVPLASGAGLFKIMCNFRERIADPFTRQMCREPGCHHYDLLLGFLRCHEDTLGCVTGSVSAQEAWEIHRVGSENENEPHPVSENDAAAVQEWTRYRVFGTDALSDQGEPDAEHAELPVLSFVFNADGAGISVSIDTAQIHPRIADAQQLNGVDDDDDDDDDDGGSVTSDEAASGDVQA